MRSNIFLSIMLQHRFCVDCFGHEQGVIMREITLEKLNRHNEMLSNRRNRIQGTVYDIYHSITTLMKHLSMTPAPVLAPYNAIDVLSRTTINNDNHLLEAAHAVNHSLQVMEMEVNKLMDVVSTGRRGSYCGNNIQVNDHAVHYDTLENSIMPAANVRTHMESNQENMDDTALDKVCLILERLLFMLSTLQGD